MRKVPVLITKAMRRAFGAGSTFSETVDTAQGYVVTVTIPKQHRPCVHCGHAFQITRPDNRYCRGQCRVEASRLRKQAHA